MLALLRKVKSGKYTTGVALCLVSISKKVAIDSLNDALNSFP